MANRKAKSKTNISRAKKAKPKPIAGKPVANSNNQLTNKILPLAIIVIAIIALIFGLSSFLSKPSDQINPLPEGSMVEKIPVGQMVIPNAVTVTYKMEELSGSDCTKQIVAELQKLGGIATVRADYANQLFEVKYDPAKIKLEQITEALNKGEHPGQPTEQKIIGN
ncbi:MAG: cation transporter [Firmicutes bacterium]|nr:cation transporter [Bacillota bacterium]